MHNTAYEIPRSFKLAYSKSDIDDRLSVVASDISTWARQVTLRDGIQPVAVGILRGCAFFYADLVRAMNTSVEVDFCRAWTYHSDVNEQKEQNLKYDLNHLNIEGRAVLLIDDICDTGNTFMSICQNLRNRGACEVRSVAAVFRRIGADQFKPDWSLFEHKGEEWFVGYGMEDKNHFSNLQDIFIISGSS